MRCVKSERRTPLAVNDMRFETGAGEPRMSAAPSSAPDTPLPSLMDLQHARRWTAWQAELPPGRKKPTKVPYRNLGAFSRANAPATWIALDEARTVAASLPRPLGAGGVGIFLGDLGDGWHLVGVDYDSCLDGAGLADWATAGITCTNSYGEVSPSGEGVKQFLVCATVDLPGIKAALGIGEGKEGRRWSRAPESSAGREREDHPPGIEVYLGSRYFTVTGDSAGLPQKLARLTVEDAEALVATALPLLGPTADVAPPLRIVGADEEDGSPDFAGKGSEGSNAGTGDSDLVVGEDAARRFETALALSPPLARLWHGDLSDLTGGDTSRSAVAFRLAALLQPLGFSREETRLAVAAHPGGAGEWMAEKGDPGGDGTGREWLRAWADSRGVFGVRMGPLPEVAGLSSRDPRPSRGRGKDGGSEGEAGGSAGDDPGEEAGGAAAGVDDLVTAFNERYMVVNEAGRTVIFAPREDKVLHRRFFERQSFDDFRRMLLNRRVRIGKKEDGGWSYKPAAEVWLTHRNRRQYIDGVTFDPSGRESEPGTLNLWQGFGVEPAAPGDAGMWDRLRQHCLEVLCGGSEDLLDYLLDWLARLVQFPAAPGEVAVVMRGGEGTGKGTLARVFIRLLGQHGMSVANAKHLTGNFNAHLRDCVLLFADEAFYAGDPAHVGVLKNLITEPYLTVEAKYANAVQSPNFLHLMMASNAEWVVPAALDARRFLVLEASGARAGDHAWFGAIWDELEAGGTDAGYRALLRDLLARDLSGFNVRRVPDTEGLRRQKVLSLSGADAWWLDVLHRGCVAPRMGLAQWQDEVARDLLYDAYHDAMKDAREYRPMNRVAFGRFMTRMGCWGVRLAATTDGRRPWGYGLGDLEQARRRFNDTTGLAVDWTPEERRKD